MYKAKILEDRIVFIKVKGYSSPGVYYESEVHFTQWMSYDGNIAKRLDYDRIDVLNKLMDTLLIEFEG